MISLFTKEQVYAYIHILFDVTRALFTANFLYIMYPYTGLVNTFFYIKGFPDSYLLRRLWRNCTICIFEHLKVS